MPFISVTRLRLRSPWYLPKFFWHAIRSNMQVRKAAGNLAFDTLSDTNFAFWTKTAWKDQESMRAFMLSGAHKQAMPALARMCDEASVVHWTQDSAELPTWQEAHRRLQAEGRRSNVKSPSVAHEVGQIAPPKG